MVCMKKNRVILCLLGGLLPLSLAAQNPDSNSLPSAPSTTVAPKPTATPATTSKSEQKTEDGSAPVIKSLGGSERKAAPANSPVEQLTPPADAASKPAAPAPTHPARNSADVEDGLTTIVKRVEEVNVIFTVSDKRGPLYQGSESSRFSCAGRQTPAGCGAKLCGREQSTFARWSVD
jgi:hypothetical protein